MVYGIGMDVFSDGLVCCVVGGEWRSGGGKWIGWFGEEQIERNGVGSCCSSRGKRFGLGVGGLKRWEGWSGEGGR